MLVAIVSWIIFGFFAGIIAKLLMPGKDPGGALVTILLGVGGAIIGGLLGQLLFNYGNGIDSTSAVREPEFFLGLFLAVVGAVIILAIYRIGTGRSLQG